MDITFQKLLSLGLDLERVGLMQREDNEGYFCTPRDAFLLGWAGVDGIHYCQVTGLGETVFVVDPMAGDDPVHPIAHNVTDMLRLLLACGDMAAPAQAHMFDSKQSFGEFLIKCRPDSETREVLEAIGRGLGITPMPLPYKYLKELQDSFDMGAVPYTEEYYEVIG